MNLEHLADLDNNEAGSGAAEINDEVFRDQMQAAQAAITAIRKAEGNAKAHDDKVAVILMRLLKKNAAPELMLLISRCLAANVPAGLLVGILALTQDEARQAWAELVGAEAAALLPSASTTNTQAIATTGDRLPPHLLAALQKWAGGLIDFGRGQPVRVLSTAASPEGELLPSLVQLVTFTLREYLASQNTKTPYENLRGMAEILLQKVLAALAETIQKTTHLKSGTEK